MAATGSLAQGLRHPQPAPCLPATTPVAATSRREHRRARQSSAAPVALRASPEDALATSSAVTPHYVPSPVAVGPEIYVAAAACLLVFAVGAWEFTKRIVIQQRCGTCGGSGLVSGRAGRLRKCTACGGFFPWLGWKTFFTSTAAPGNGGPLLQPRGQTSVLYRVPPERKGVQREQRDSGTPAAGEGAAAQEASSRGDKGGVESSRTKV